MASQITVTGSIGHGGMPPDKVIERVRESFPRATKGGADFVIPLTDCTAELFCSSNSTLQFSIIATNSSNPNRSVRAVTAAELLVRSTETLWQGLRKSLKPSKFRRSPRLEWCIIEDAQSKSPLLVRDDKSPLASPGAKVAYGATALFLLIGAVLCWWQIKDPSQASNRTPNLLQIILSLGLSAISMPIPILVNWLQWRKSLVWRYVRAGQ